MAMIGNCDIQYFAAVPNNEYPSGTIYYNTMLHRMYVSYGYSTKTYKLIPPVKDRVYLYNGMSLVYNEETCRFETVDHGKTFHKNETPTTLTAGYCISSTGTVSPNTSYSISTPIKLSPGDKIMYSSYADATVCAIAETDAGATKYTPIVIGDTRSGAYEYTADHEMYIVFTMRNSGARYTGVVESTTTEEMTLNWEMPGFFTAFGIIAGPSLSVPGYAISTPIKLYAGDVVTFSCYAIANDPVMLEYQDRWNTFWANVLGNANILIMPSATGYNTYTAYVRKTAHYVFSCDSMSSPAPVLTIARPISSDVIISAYENKWDYGQEKHKYVDKYDFVPDLAKKRTNAILTYSGDSKSNSNYIVNAVAYPNGEIIAARAGGAVVKIALDGTETTLLTISNAQDWRGVFMDSSLNVYVSPHSSTFSPGVAMIDRSLYRLPWREHFYKGHFPLPLHDGDQSGLRIRNISLVMKSCAITRAICISARWLTRLAQHSIQLTGRLFRIGWQIRSIPSGVCANTTLAISGVRLITHPLTSLTLLNGTPRPNICRTTILSGQCARTENGWLYAGCVTLRCIDANPAIMPVFKWPEQLGSISMNLS